MTIEMIVQLATNVGVVGAVLLVFLLRIWPQMLADHNQTIREIVEQNNVRERAMQEAYQAEIAAGRTEATREREVRREESKEVTGVLRELAATVSLCRYNAKPS